MTIDDDDAACILAGCGVRLCAVGDKLSQHMLSKSALLLFTHPLESWRCTRWLRPPSGWRLRRHLGSPAGIDQRSVEWVSLTANPPLSVVLAYVNAQC